MKTFLLAFALIVGAVAAEEARDKRGLLLGAPSLLASPGLYAAPSVLAAPAYASAYGPAYASAYAPAYAPAYAHSPVIAHAPVLRSPILTPGYVGSPLLGQSLYAPAALL